MGQITNPEAVEAKIHEATDIFIRGALTELISARVGVDVQLIAIQYNIRPRGEQPELDSLEPGALRGDVPLLNTSESEVN